MSLVWEIAQHRQRDSSDTSSLKPGDLDCNVKDPFPTKYSIFIGSPGWRKFM